MSHASTQLIPRATLFGNPDKAMVSISPDGQRIAYLAPKDGVLNVYLATIDDVANAKPITDDRSRGIRNYFWGYDNLHIFYLQDDKGNENWSLYKVNLQTLQSENLTPFENVYAGISKRSRKFPDKLIISLNKEDPKYFDLYELDVLSGTLKMFYKNEKQLSSFLLDENYSLRFATKATDDGGNIIFEIDEQFNLKPFMEISYEDSMNTGLVKLTDDGNTLYLIDSRNTNTTALISVDLKKKTRKVVFHDKKSDIGNVRWHPTHKTVQSVSTIYLKTKEHIIDQSIKKDMALLAKKHADSEPHVTSRNLADTHWIVAYMFDDKPVHYYLFNRQTKSLQFLFTNRKELEHYELSKVKPVIIKSRDGLKLIGYLTVPKGIKTPVPLVVNVHGGPHVRDVWGFNSEDQWLANRGYSVLRINYRGSTGFGKKFVNASDGEWGGKMHEDIIDAVQWAIDNKITTKDKVCIYGGSYGGYEALVGLSFTPDVFACGVDIVGPSNLVTLVKSIPPYWASYYNKLLKRIGGDPDTPEGQEFLYARSPISVASNIKKPLLIAQGANDPRVKQAESDQIVAELKKHNIPVTYLLYSDEGHGFARPANRMSFYAVAEQFLAQHLGGRSEPIADAFAESSIKIVEENINK